MISFLGGLSLLILFLTLIIGFLWPFGATPPEIVIWVIFAINVVVFSLGMARTGGPARSFFSQLVPIQLAGIFMLEQQKAMLMKTQVATWKFVAVSAIACLVWLSVVLFRERFEQLLQWQEHDMNPWLERFTVFATTFLFFLSVGVTVFAYWAPLRPEFVEFISRHRQL
jgi:hypothetical protein